MAVRVVLDTNTVISGIFYRGAPWRVFELARTRKIQAVITMDIVIEYESKCFEKAEDFHSDDPLTVLARFLAASEFLPEPNSERAGRDKTDYKFIGCALLGNVPIIVSGDKDLLTMNGYRGISIMNASSFLDWFAKNS